MFRTRKNIFYSSDFRKPVDVQRSSGRGAGWDPLRAAYRRTTHPDIQEQISHTSDANPSSDYWRGYQEANAVALGWCLRTTCLDS